MEQEKRENYEIECKQVESEGIVQNRAKYLAERPKAEQLGDTKSTVFCASEYSVAVAQLARYGDAISKEFTLVNDRMTWLVVAESFIFSAFATSAAYYATSGSMKYLVGCLLIFMPLLGIFLAKTVIPAIKAAHEATDSLKERRDSFESRLPEHLQVRMITCKDPQHEKGNIPAKRVPKAIIFFWLALLAMTLFCLCKNCFG
ncbi:MAG: hypothetical protein AB1489_38810 [Acidobacteriota bacterium]